MESSKVVRAVGAEWVVMPVTWDRHTPAPGNINVHEAGTEKTPTFEMSDLGSGDGFGEGEGERTVITTASPYDLRPKFTGRSGGIQQLQELIEAAWKQNQLAFAVVIGEAGMGKSRMLGEIVARAKSQFPNVHVLQGIADENSNAYGPIARALTVRFALSPGEDPAESRDKIQAGVAEVVQASRVTEIAHLIAHLLRVP